MTRMLRFFHSPVALFSTGLAVFVIGLALAVPTLPEWNPEPLPDRDVFRTRADQTVHRLGLRKLDSFHIALTEKGMDSGSTSAERGEAGTYLGQDAASWLEERGRTFHILADTQVRNDQGNQLSLDLQFSLQGELVSIRVIPDEFDMGLVQKNARPGIEPEQVVSVLLREGERVGDPEVVATFGSEMTVYPVLDREGVFVESISLETNPTFPTIAGRRQPATAAQVVEHRSEFAVAHLLRIGWRLATRVGFALAILLLLAVLITRRSLGLRNAVLFAMLQFVLVIVPVVRGQRHLVETIVMDLLFLASAFMIFIAWSAAESWYRILSDEPTTGLDHIRERILGRDEGRSLVAGWGAGAVVAGAFLILAVLAHVIGWLHPTSLSVDLSAVYDIRNPWFSAVMITVAILLAHSSALRWAPSGRRTHVALVAGTLMLIPTVPLAPFPVAVLIAIGLTLILVWTLREHRLLGLLTAAVTALSLPLAVFSLMHPTWQPFELIVSGGFVTAPLLLGLVGMRRSETERREKVATPMFMRRLEHERRLRYEMDLLARMQLGLLPDAPPSLDGWEVAVRSVLPTEVGGDFYEFIEDDEGCLWIAMGDVSGHGYQCSIVHAMTKAALLSLVSSKLRPGEIMDRLDQVLRHSGTARTFVALALMRIDLVSGEIDYSNAASPFPIVIDDDGVREIEISTLPLGHGPVQAYHDHRFVIERGTAIVFWSDGLYEARNTREEEYGYDRAGIIGRENLDADAKTIMESIFDDWTTFRGESELEDDTTVLVIKRA